MNTISSNELTQKMISGEQFALINVLPPEYFEQAHIPGSANVPSDIENFAQIVEEMIGTKDMPIVVYCANHSCTASNDAAQKLSEHGFADVTDFSGGTQEWLESGKPLQSFSGGGCCGGGCGCD